MCNTEPVRSKTITARATVETEVPKLDNPCAASTRANGRLLSNAAYLLREHRYANRIRSVPEPNSPSISLKRSLRQKGTQTRAAHRSGGTDKGDLPLHPRKSDEVPQDPRLLELLREVYVLGAAVLIAFGFEDGNEGCDHMGVKLQATLIRELRLRLLP